MFDKATERFVRIIQGRGSKGGLIHNTRLIDSSKLLDPTRLLIQTKPRWPIFQKNSYRVSDYKLEDLIGDPPCPEWFRISPMVDQYEHLCDQKVAGKMGADVLDVGGKVVGQGTTKLQSTFGPLNKHEVDILKVKRSIKNKTMQEDPGLKEGETLVLVKERIVTTTSITLEGTDQVDATCIAKGMAVLFQLFIGGVHSRTEKCSLEIPPDAVIAYSVTELKELNCANMDDDDDMKGLERDGISDDLRSFLEDATSQDNILERVWKALREFEDVLQPLADLPLEAKSSLFLQLREILKDRTDFRTLLEHVNGTALESAVDLLVSSLEELPDVVVHMLVMCRPEDLQALNTLVSSRKSGSERVSLESLPRPLQDRGELNWATQLFCSSTETLRDMDTLWAETGIQPGVLLLVLCIAVQGLASVCG